MSDIKSEDLALSFARFFALNLFIMKPFFAISLIFLLSVDK